MATRVPIPGVMRFAQWIGAVDRGGYRKVFQGQMPLLGGLGIAIPLALMAVTASIVGHAIVANWTWVAAQYPDHFDLLFAFANSRTDCLVLALGGAGIVVWGLWTIQKACARATNCSARSVSPYSFASAASVLPTSYNT